MTHLFPLVDHQAEALSGGFRFTSIRSIQLAGTNAGQINESNNLGLGAGVGFGWASSLQGNVADVLTAVV
jgi:hypothetical protein